MRDFKGMKRQRGRNRGSGGPGGGGGQGGGKPQQNVNRAFDSNGPDGVKVRGHAQSVYEKYQQLARDAFSSGDRVLAENHLQHAEHYFRVLRLIQPQRPTAEIVARDVFASGFDIDFEDEEAAVEAPAEDARSDEREAYGDRARAEQGRGEQGRQDQGRQDQGRADRGERREGRYGDRQNGERQNGDRQNGDRQNGERSNGYGGERAGPEREPERAYGRQEGERQGGERQGSEGQNGERQNGRQRQNDRGDRPRYEGRREERAGGYGEQPREYGRDRAETRAPEPQAADGEPAQQAEAALVERPDAPSVATQRVEARVEAVRPDPLPVVEPQARPLTSLVQPDAPAPEPAEGARVLRSQDGGISEAPAFLQAFVAPALSGTDLSDEPAPKRPRGRPRKRAVDGEDAVPAPAAEEV